MNLPTRLYRVQRVSIDSKGQPWAGQVILHDESHARSRYAKVLSELSPDHPRNLVELGYNDCWPDAEGRLSPKGSWTVMETKYVERVLELVDAAN